MSLPVAIQANHLITREPSARRMVGLDALEFRRVLVTVEAILIIKAHASHDRFFVGVGCVARQVSKSRHLRFHVSAESVVAVTVIALVFGDPFVLVVARSQSSAVRVHHIVRHGAHYMTACAPTDFVYAFKGVIVGDEYGTGRHYDQSRKSHQLGSGFRGQSGYPERSGRRVIELAEAHTSRANAQQDAHNTEQDSK